MSYGLQIKKRTPVLNYKTTPQDFAYWWAAQGKPKKQDWDISLCKQGSRTSVGYIGKDLDIEVHHYSCGCKVFLKIQDSCERTLIVNRRCRKPKRRQNDKIEYDR
jgi:hypothetical protein